MFGRKFSKYESLNSNDNVVVYLGGFGSALHAVGIAIAEKNKIPYLGIAFALTSPHEQGFEYLFAPFPKSADLARDIFDVLNAYMTTVVGPVIFNEDGTGNVKGHLIDLLL